MVTLLVAITVMSILMSAILPTWRHQAKREREEELIFRGTQYARAIALFQRKFPGAFPPNIQVLLDQKFLRRKYVDPMTADGEFQVVFQSAQTVPGQPGGIGAPTPGQPVGPGGARPGGGAFGGPGVAPPQPGVGLPGTSALAGPQGGIIGVVSKSKDASIKLYNGRSRYSEWVFDVTAVAQSTGVPGMAAPGAVPGAVPGAAQPGQIGRPPGFGPPPGPGLPGPGQGPGIGRQGPGGAPGIRRP